MKPTNKPIPVAVAIDIPVAINCPLKLGKTYNTLVDEKRPELLF